VCLAQRGPPRIAELERYNFLTKNHDEFVYGTEKNAKMIVTAADGTVLRRDGEDSLMFRTDHKVVYEKTTNAMDATPDAKDLGDIVAGGGTHHPLPKGGRGAYSDCDDDIDRATLIGYLQTSPQYFIGKYVYSVYDGKVR
jgi:hypothetical protein